MNNVPTSPDSNKAVQSLSEKEKELAAFLQYVWWLLENNEKWKDCAHGKILRNHETMIQQWNYSKLIVENLFYYISGNMRKKW